MKKTITICSSVSFYKDIPPLVDKLEAMGFNVLLPDVAKKMQLANDFSYKKTWYDNKADYHKKTKLMDDHFKKVVKGDAVLVVNYDKNGLIGYVGGNVLMEMTVAYLNKKKIFILHPIDEKLPLKEEVYGLQSIFLNGKLKAIKKYLKP